MGFFESIQSCDLAVLDWIRETVSCRPLDVFFKIATLFGEYGVFWLALGIVLTCVPKYRRCGLTVLISVALGFCCANLVIKPLVARIRPYDIRKAVTLIVRKLTDYSFPSGHTVASFAAALPIFYDRKKPGIAALILAGLVALSRMYLYVHYPTDVLAGALIGFAASVAARTLVRAAFDRYEQKCGKTHSSDAADGSRDSVPPCR